ncbi:MAG: serine/threonine-protein kinase [Planctomycetota bacterium]
MEGRELGAYRLQSELGSGGMGKVYKALDAEGNAVALKIVHPHLLESPGFFKRFLREAEAGRRIEHENVVRTLDVDATVLDDRHYHYLVMEYVEGQALSDLLRELERVPEVLCRHIGREVAVALEAIHAAGVVHRDLKPENVLITPDQAVKVMDLSVASLADEAMRLSQHSQFVGSLLYAAPEQFRLAEVDGRADYYALGLILYELATGQNPLGGETFAEAMQRALNETPRPAAEINPQLSPFLEELLKALLEKEPDRRPSGVREILERGEDSTWWKERATEIRLETQRPLRRIRIPRETALCGREEELARLRRLYEAAAAGQARVVVIEGEAGIGKTRLVDEFVARLRGEGEEVHFLFGAYPHGGTRVAAGAFSEAYREHFGAAGSAAYLSATPLLVPAFDALLSGEPPPRGEEPLNGESLQTAFVHATRALAAEKTTIVLAEDLNGAPAEGRALFNRLALAAPGHRILLLGTARPGLPEEWRAGLQRQDHATLLTLARLGPKDLTGLLIDAFHSDHPRPARGQVPRARRRRHVGPLARHRDDRDPRHGAAADPGAHRRTDRGGSRGAGRSGVSRLRVRSAPRRGGPGSVRHPVAAAAGAPGAEAPARARGGAALRLRPPPGAGVDLRRPVRAAPRALPRRGRRRARAP